MRLLRSVLLVAVLAVAAGCGDSGGVTKPGQVAPAPDKSDPGLKGGSDAPPPP